MPWSLCLGWAFVPVQGSSVLRLPVQGEAWAAALRRCRESGGPARPAPRPYSASRGLDRAKASVERGAAAPTPAPLGAHTRCRWRWWKRVRRCSCSRRAWGELGPIVSAPAFVPARVRPPNPGPAPPRPFSRRSAHRPVRARPLPPPLTGPPRLSPSPRGLGCRPSPPSSDNWEAKLVAGSAQVEVRNPLVIFVEYLPCPLPLSALGPKITGLCGIEMIHTYPGRPTPPGQMRGCRGPDSHNK